MRREQPYAAILDLCDSLRAGPATITGLCVDTGRSRKAVESAIRRAIAAGWVERDEAKVILPGGAWAYVHRLTQRGRQFLAIASSAVVAEGARPARHDARGEGRLTDAPTRASAVTDRRTA